VAVPLAGVPVICTVVIVPLPAVSLLNTLVVTGMFWPVVAVSFTAVGGVNGVMVTVTFAVPVFPLPSVIV
jgi:hypothetical protein